MNLTNPLYSSWNCDYIQQQALQQYHQNQRQQVIEVAYKLKDFLDSVDKVDPAYQGSLSATCYAIVGDYIKKHRII